MAVMAEEITKRRTLEELRKEHRLTRAELGEALGVSDVTVLIWEQGRSQPRPAAHAEICNFFQISPDELDLEPYVITDEHRAKLSQSLREAHARRRKEREGEANPQQEETASL